eukprot:gene1476-2797_t
MSPLWVALVSWATVHRATSLTPLTEVDAEAAELAVFPQTLQVTRHTPPTGRQAAAEKLRLGPGPVVHVVGATKVEDSADWSALCSSGAAVVLVGPQVEPLAKMTRGEELVRRDRPGQGCVKVVRGLYSRQVVREALGAGQRGAEPDLIITFNADLYMDYWRRTLADILLAGLPVVVTMYCEYEGGQLGPVLENTLESFTAANLKSTPHMLSNF